jgi:class 3 adenylate cyclase
MQPPPVEYVQTPDGVNIAYQTFGAGPIDILFVGSWFGQIDLRWEWPGYCRWFERLAAIGRVAVFDKRGVGASDPAPPHSVTLEDWVGDARAVMDAVGFERAAVVTWTDATAVGLSLAATFPNRTSALVLVNWSYDLFRRLVRTRPTIGEWGTEAGLAHLATIAPTSAADPAYRDWFARMQRASCGPGAVQTMYEMLSRLDVEALLPSITVPTICIRRDALPTSDEVTRSMVARIPQARMIEVPGRDVQAWVGDVDPLIDEVETFLTGTRPSPTVDRALLTVVFADIVDSTRRLAELGDAKWAALLEVHNRDVRRIVAEYRGAEVMTKGDEFVLTFDGPARAVRCAAAIHACTASRDLEMRTGIHTGEVELHGDDIAGIAVHIAARVREKARPGEIVVSRTVKDLVAGSGLEFAERGNHALKGVPEQWHLYAVV